MKEDNLKLAQKGIDDALETIDALEKTIKQNPLEKKVLKQSFNTLSKKVDEIETILKNEGIL
jgi:archaellum component FlaC